MRLLAWCQAWLIRWRVLCPHGRLDPCQDCVIARVQARLGYTPLSLHDDE